MIQDPWTLAAVFALVPVLWAAPDRWRSWALALASFAVLAATDPLAPVVLMLAALPWFVWRLPDSPWTRRAALLVPAVLLLLRARLQLSGFTLIGSGYLAFRLYQLTMARQRNAALRDIPLDRFLAWISFFPIFSAGPIEPWGHWTQDARPTAADLATGGTRLAVGIGKAACADLLLRGAVGALVGERLTVELSFGATWAWAFLSFFYGYVGFSAYSDMAIGASRMLGRPVVENFDWPILATSLPDFWRRWHMSLMRFCQENVYMPAIGRTRSPYLASVSTFLIMGLWHQPSPAWVLWGLHHAAGMTLSVWLTQQVRKRGWRWPTGRAFALAGWAATMTWVALGSAWTATGGATQGPVMVARLLGFGTLW